MKKVLVFSILCILLLSITAIARSDENESPKKIILGKSNEIQSTSVADKTETRVEIKRNDAKEQVRERFENKTEEIRTHQKEKLMAAVEKCSEKNMSPELCGKKFEKRTELVQRLKEKDLERVNKIEERRLEIRSEIEEMKENQKLRAFAVSNKSMLREIKRESAEKMNEKVREMEKKENESGRNMEKREKEMLRLREKVRLCSDNATNATDECRKVSNESFESAKDYLLNAVERAINALEKIKARVNSSEFLSEEEASNILVELNAEEANISAIKSQIENAGTREELRNAALSLKSEWENIREIHRTMQLRLALSHFGGIIVKSKNLEVKLNNVLEKLVIENKSVEGIEPLIIRFNEDINDTKENFNSAHEILSAALASNSKEERKEMLEKAHSYMQKSKKSLKAAAETLKEILEKAKEEDRSVLEEPEINED